MPYWQGSQGAGCIGIVLGGSVARDYAAGRLVMVGNVLGVSVARGCAVGHEVWVKTLYQDVGGKRIPWVSVARVIARRGELYNMGGLSPQGCWVSFPLYATFVASYSTLEKSHLRPRAYTEPFAAVLCPLSSESTSVHRPSVPWSSTDPRVPSYVLPSSST